ncbi:sensor histidine kinase [Arthrobacter sp. P2b]|uniref:sensor histidine kinase n=1 Tax=Arthrobacter sp. P2b TaxID=1938741 RepID=UPI0009A625D5|nr:HAMP domain-containing sensor histidine kinase [Arthrobacter sp. P2b]SLK12041.1 GHKL domain-containing protein [Arthrobacter sp. P2b]
MDQQGVLTIVALLTGLLGLFVAFYASAENRRSRSNLQRLTSKWQQEQDYRFSYGESNDRQPDRLMLEVLRRIGEITPVVNVNVSNPDSDRAAGDHPNSRRPTTSEDSQSVVGEIAHSLNTPLSQIEAATLVLVDSSRVEGVSDIESIQSLNRILSSIEICKVFIGAYSELSKVAARSKEWTSQFLSEAVSKSGIVYQARDGQLTYEGPDEVPGYSNTFILATMLPLIENAVEASRDLPPDESAISVRCRESLGWLHLTVTNSLGGNDLDDSIYNAGHSTKPDHQGLGLSAVRRLVTAHSGTISHEVRGDQVTFQIKLPEKK